MAFSARRKRLSIVYDAELGPDDTITVGDYLQQWLGGKQSLRPSTLASYATHIRCYLRPSLGSIELRALRPAHIEQMHRGLLTANESGRQLSVASVHRVHATLRSALNTAVRRGLIPRNPADTVELPRTPKARVEIWSAAELRRFLDLIRDDRLHLLYLLLGLSGMRRGEALALRWTDVDLDAGLLRIERSLVPVDGELVVGPPKSSSGRRVVALDEEIVRRLHWHRCRQRLEVLRATGDVRVSELVFTTASGEPLSPTYVSRHFDRLVAKHALPRIRLHDLRHTSASIGLASGESLVEVSRRLGHSTITVTADTYSHVSPVVAKESAERLARTVLHHD